MHGSWNDGKPRPHHDDAQRDAADSHGKGGGQPPAPLASDRQSSAMARLILKRAGIAPLLGLALALVMPAATAPADAQPVTAPATARVIILPSSVQVRASGDIAVRGSGAQSPQPRPTVSERRCDPATPPAPVPETPAAPTQVAPACRPLIVANMP
ncbi:MAG: hypothetical protein MUF41_02360 [Sphingopyxis sp.]|nr:hypothetical protein [Sphingopyxis sp.]